MNRWSIFSETLCERRLWPIVLAIIVVFAGMIGFSMGSQSSPFEKATPTSVSPAASGVGAVRAVTTTGVLKPSLLIEVGTQLSGTVVEISADFNDTVRRDQPLARLAPETFEAAMREARAALAVAQATENLRASAIDRAKAKAAAAKAGLAIAKARLQRAQAKRRTAAREYKRKRPLAKRGNIPASALDRAASERQISIAATREAEAEQQSRMSIARAAEADVKMAEANWQVAQATTAQRQAALDRALVDLNRTVIRSPIDGVVIARKVDRGQTVAASLNAPTLFTVARDLRSIEVHANINEADIGRIQNGQTATFTVDAYPERRFHGAVRQVRKAPSVIQNVVSYTIVIATENKDMTLLPGMTALVRIDSNQRSSMRAPTPNRTAHDLKWRHRPLAVERR